MAPNSNRAQQGDEAPTPTRTVLQVKCSPQEPYVTPNLGGSQTITQPQSDNTISPRQSLTHDTHSQNEVVASTILSAQLEMASQQTLQSVAPNITLENPFDHDFIPTDPLLRRYRPCFLTYAPPQVPLDRQLDPAWNPDAPITLQEIEHGVQELQARAEFQGAQMTLLEEPQEEVCREMQNRGLIEQTCTTPSRIAAIKGRYCKWLQSLPDLDILVSSHTAPTPRPDQLSETNTLVSTVAPQQELERYQLESSDVIQDVNDHIVSHRQQPRTCQPISVHEGHSLQPQRPQQQQCNQQAQLQQDVREYGRRNKQQQRVIQNQWFEQRYQEVIQREQRNRYDSNEAGPSTQFPVLNHPRQSEYVQSGPYLNLQPDYQGYPLQNITGGLPTTVAQLTPTSSERPRSSNKRTQEIEDRKLSIVWALQAEQDHERRAAVERRRAADLISRADHADQWRRAVSSPRMVENNVNYNQSNGVQNGQTHSLENMNRYYNQTNGTNSLPQHRVETVPQVEEDVQSNGVNLPAQQLVAETAPQAMEDVHQEIPSNTPVNPVPSPPAADDVISRGAVVDEDLTNLTDERFAEILCAENARLKALRESRK